MGRDKVAVVGLGYVGIPLASVLADNGFDVLGVDAIPEKVQSINVGTLPLKGIEPGLQDLLNRVVREGNLVATSDFKGCSETQTIFVCVDTPIDADKKPDNRHLKDAVEEIGWHMSRGTLVIVESTVAPGTMMGVIRPALEKSSRMRIGADFMLAHCPERVMPGRLLNNLTTCDRVIGAFDEESARRAISVYSRFSKGKLHTTGLIEAEIAKTVENAYRDVQIAFANEVALMCERLGADAYEIRRLVNSCPFRDMHLPGAGVGGHCLPKDPWLLVYAAGQSNSALIPTAREINDYMPRHVAELADQILREAKIERSKANITILGGSFLQETGDARNSPTISLLDCLKGVGLVKVHDPYLDEIAGMKVDRNLESSLKDADLAVFMVSHSEYLKLTPSRLKELMRRPAILDGRNLFSAQEMMKAGFIYKGIGKGVPQQD